MVPLPAAATLPGLTQALCSMTNSFVHQTKSWLRRILRWLAKPRLAWFSLLIVGISIYFALRIGTEDAVRLWGLALQLLGLAAAALGIRDTRRMFGKPSFLQLVRGWISSIPGFSPPTQTIELSGTASVGCAASANLWAGTKPGASIEDRLNAAESNLRALENRLNAAESGIETNHRELTHKIRDESDIRKEQIRLLDLRIEAASTDGLHLAAAGAFWLAVGVTMSTAPKELLCILGAA